MTALPEELVPDELRAGLDVALRCDAFPGWLGDTH